MRAVPPALGPLASSLFLALGLYGCGGGGDGPPPPPHELSVMVAIKPRPTAVADAPPQPLDMTRVYVGTLRDGVAGSGIRSVAARLDGEPIATLAAANVYKPTPSGHAAYHGFDIAAARLGTAPHDLSVAVTAESGRIFTMQVLLLPGEATVEERVFAD